jgi:hypothetical protein
MAAALELERLDDIDALLIDRDLDYVTLNGQLDAVHDQACEEDFGQARFHLPDEYDFSFSPLEIPVGRKSEENKLDLDSLDLHEFIIKVMRNPDAALWPTPGCLESILRLNQVAKDEDTLLFDNILTSRTTRVTDATNRQLEYHYPGIFNAVNLTGNVTPDPPEFPKWRHHIESALALKALGLKVGKVFIDDTASAVGDCVNKGGSNLGIVFGDYRWNQGKLPELDPDLDPQLHKIVRCKTHAEVTRVIISTFFPNAA